jgi:hypothetical protein
LRIYERERIVNEDLEQAMARLMFAKCIGALKYGKARYAGGLLICGELMQGRYAGLDLGQLHSN